MTNPLDLCTVRGYLSQATSEDPDDQAQAAYYAPDQEDMARLILDQAGDIERLQAYVQELQAELGHGRDAFGGI